MSVLSGNQIRERLRREIDDPNGLCIAPLLKEEQIGTDAVDVHVGNYFLRSRADLIEAYKIGKPEHISYHGKMKVSLTYVGVYEVTTPAGIWPAALFESDFEIKIGPAHVEDIQYIFLAKGVGKVAEVESLNVSALLVYHSNEKTGKLLVEYPQR